MKMQCQPKKPETRFSFGFLVRKSKHCVKKSQLVKLAQNLRKSQLFEANVDLT